MNASTGSIRLPQRMTLPVPHIPGSSPTAVAETRTSRLAGPFRANVSAVRRASIALLSLSGSILPTVRDRSFPLAIVSQYPASDATAADSSSIRNGPEANPPRDPSNMSPMTRAVPDLPFPETDRVTSASTDVTVPIEATVEMNLAGSLSGCTAADIEAPTVEVIPGNHPAMVPIRTPRSPGRTPTGSETRSFCGGIPDALPVSSSTGTPNSPVRRGIMTLPSPSTPSMGIGSTIQPSPRVPERSIRAGPHRPLPLRHSDESRTAHASISTAGVRRSSSPSAP